MDFCFTKRITNKIRIIYYIILVFVLYFFISFIILSKVNAANLYTIGLDERLMHTYLAEDESENTEIQYIIKYFKENYITPNMNDFEKEIQIIKYLVETVKFDEDELNNSSRIITNSYKAYGALVNRKAVCSGYAKAFDLLAKSCGLSTTIVTGEATNSKNLNGPHAWNQIYLAGDWYNVDVTWEDPLGSNIKLGFNNLLNKYINRTDSEFAINHTRETGNNCISTRYGASVVAYYLYTGVIDITANTDKLIRLMLSQIKSFHIQNLKNTDNHQKYNPQIKDTINKLSFLGAIYSDNSNLLSIDNQVVNSYIVSNLLAGETVIAFVTLANSKNMLDIDKMGWLQNNVQIPANVSLQNYFSSDGILDTRILIFDIAYS